MGSRHGSIRHPLHFMHSLYFPSGSQTKTEDCRFFSGQMMTPGGGGLLLQGRPNGVEMKQVGPRATCLGTNLAISFDPAFPINYLVLY